MSAMADDGRVNLDVDGTVGVVTLHHPERLNAMTRAMAEQLVDLLAELRRRDEVRALVLTGAGRAFCAGAQLGQGAGQPGRADLKLPVGIYSAVTRGLIEVDKPVIAAISGPAVGAGLAYALACDRRFADGSARLSAIFVKRGLHPDCGASFFLPRLAGLPLALKMLTTGVMLDAEAAHAAGLIDELVPEGQALGAAIEYARQYGAAASVAVELARRAAYHSLWSSLDQVLYLEGFGAGVAGRTDDVREGLAAFQERRAPRFRGL